MEECAPCSKRGGAECGRVGSDPQQHEGTDLKVLVEHVGIRHLENAEEFMDSQRRYVQVVSEHALHSAGAGRVVPLLCKERGTVCVGQKRPERQLLGCRGGEYKIEGKWGEDEGEAESESEGEG